MFEVEYYFSKITCKECFYLNFQIAILRSQLKQANKTIDYEKMQKFKILEENQEKWTSKFNVASKDLTTLKCDVELKVYYSFRIIIDIW